MTCEKEAFERVFSAREIKHSLESPLIFCAEILSSPKTPLIRLHMSQMVLLLASGLPASLCSLANDSRQAHYQ